MGNLFQNFASPTYWIPFLKEANLLSKAKIEHFIGKMIFFYHFAHNIDCVYMLEQPRRGGNEYPPSMFWIKNKKNTYTPANPSFSKLNKKETQQ